MNKIFPVSAPLAEALNLPAEIDGKPVSWATMTFEGGKEPAMTTRDDRALLEAAAKAAGIDLSAEEKHENYCAFWHYEDICTCGGRWNPLERDDHALRLAVKMGLNVIQMASLSGPEPVAAACGFSGEDYAKTRVGYGADPYAATRRAITRAAAALGEQG